MIELVELDQLVARYGDTTALRSVSLRLRTGELVALAGPNGSGKSTLFRVIVGLVPMAEGRATLAGRPLLALPFLTRAQQVSWMPQEEAEGDDLEVGDYVRYGRNPYLGSLLPEPDPDPGAVERALSASGTQELVRRNVRQLSGGERQRVRLARVLAQETPLVLLDEPTAHLDIAHQLEVLERVRAVAHRMDRCVVVALHDLNLAARFADRIIVLSHGQKVADGVPDAVLSTSLLRQVWGVEAELRRGTRERVPYLIPRLPPVEGPTPEKGARGRRVHVVAGGGSGQEILRRLFDAGYDLTVGALPLFDSDSELAEELGLPLVLEVPFAPLSAETLARLATLLSRAEFVVVAAFPVGPTNLANLEAVERTGEAGRVLLMAQRGEPPWDYTGGRATAVRARLLRAGARELTGTSELLGALSEPRGQASEGQGPTA
ncbi:MAG: ABC transporter ATP-binding protein [Thermoplasmata archaeon]|nr:ABC transporter ATP-binding protein [Thermoplasmata archaeon]